MTDSPAVRRVLVVAVAVFSLAAVLAAAIVGGDDGDDGDEVAATGRTTTTTAAAPTTSGGAVPGDATTSTSAPSASETTTTSRGGSTPTTSGSTAATSAPSPGAPPAVAVPASGTYRYRVTTGQEQREGTTKVEDKGAAANGGRNLALTLTGQGFDSVSDVVWGPEDVRVLRSRIFFGGQSFDCDWEPDHIELELPLAKGAEWSSTSSCTVAGRKVDRTSTSKVAELRRERVAGEDVDVWVIQGTERFSFGGQAEESTSTTWFSPRHGLVVRSEGQSSRGSTTLEILNLRPE